MFDIDIQNIDGKSYLNSIEKKSIDLILTDPPYVISKDTGMNAHKKHTDNIDKTGNETKTENDWKLFINKEENKNKLFNNKQKENYIKYGSIYGKKYSVTTDYSSWDTEFTIDELESFIKIFFDKLKDGGSCIIFFDLWKLSELKRLMENAGFKQIRFIEWIKTNPQPLNSKTNYLTNCREIALLGVKKGKPTFNSHYDNGLNNVDGEGELYKFPLQGGKGRFHPTQKSLNLFEELIKKHSNEGDIVMDTFLGSGTTAIACKNTNRKFKGCEKEKEYFDKILL